MQTIGRCYFEMNQYEKAKKVFQELTKLEPYRLECFDYFSTTLWFLKNQVDLVYYSNYALEKSLYAPETWCAIGNCYSLQKEHETALKFLNRAIQLNPKYAYAHTLCGHEYIQNEDFESAKKCY